MKIVFRRLKGSSLNAVRREMGLAEDKASQRLVRTRLVVEALKRFG
jgi:hypothetical protein